MNITCLCKLPWTLSWQVRRALELDAGALEVYDLAFEAGVAMETLAELVAAPLFYQRYGLSPARH